MPMDTTLVNQQWSVDYNGYTYGTPTIGSNGNIYLISQQGLERFSFS
jgi:hypothetical protein